MRKPVSFLRKRISSVKAILEDALFLILRLPLSLLPISTMAKIKFKIVKTKRLDTDKHRILVRVDSPQDIVRSRACSKEPETVGWIEDFIKPGEVFFDVGANIGAYSLYAFKHCLGNVIIHAFEPGFSTYHQLVRNILLNHAENSIFPHMLALSHTSGTSVFNYLSIEPGFSYNSLGDNLDYKGEAFEPAFRQKVFSFSLDSLVKEYGFPRPNHIKLDVDGKELDILLGAKDVLADTNLRSVIVEICKLRNQETQVVSLLSADGFKLLSKVCHGKGICWNYIFGK